MKVLQKISEIKDFQSESQYNGKVIGFVPTMGALHKGHISLVDQCVKECNVTIVSIFVNPLQFNNKDDFAKYPVTIESDLKMLEYSGCDIVFVPDVKEMYPDDKQVHYDLGEIETVMEGKFRPGHYQGVARVVHILFDIVKPDKAYFGAKDYQQIMVIKRMTEITGIKSEIIICPTVREQDGLAMSSRNMRLTPLERKSAPAIYHALSQMPCIIRERGVSNGNYWFENYVNNIPFLKCEYIEVTDSETLMPVAVATKDKTLSVFVSVYCGNIRLIDNIFFVV